LVAVGRASNASKLDLKNTEISFDEKYHIKTNEFLETSVPNIYALGDVRGEIQLTTSAYDDYRYIRDNWNGNHRPIEDRLIPRVTFIDPEFGRIGLNEQEALDQNLDFKVLKAKASRIARLSEMNRKEGLLKAIIDRKTNKILGFTAFCARGGEIIGFIQLAMKFNATIKDIADMPLAHPTVIEGLDKIFDD
jgi:pyruvate/2-oxoglutarate dehydrogenase complex dihydrolipoamide dehydrogenase (E3) component